MLAANTLLITIITTESAQKLQTQQTQTMAKKNEKQNDRQNDRAWAKKKWKKTKWSPKMIAHQNDREFFFHDYV